MDLYDILLNHQEFHMDTIKVEKIIRSRRRTVTVRKAVCEAREIFTLKWGSCEWVQQKELWLDRSRVC